MSAAARPILVVEDEADITELLFDALEGAGYGVIGSLGGGVLATVATTRPALILLDVRMPRVDGLEVCRRLQADPETREIPIVFITGAPRQEIEAQLDGCAPVAILEKPFAIDEVLALVRQHATF